MGHIEGTDRNQRVLFPESLEDYVTDDNPVRFIDAFVDGLNLEGLGFKRVKASSTGRPPYHPGDLLRLYIYGYLNRLRSSRKLERETHRNIEVMWLTRRLRPDFKTIADFRRDNLQAIKGVCREFTLLCKKLDLFAGELVGIDGSKFRADNSRERNFTKDKLKKRIQKIDERIEAYLKALDENDEDESDQRRDDAEQLQEKIAQLQERKQGYQDLARQLESSGEGQISLTDPDSRAMLMNGRVEVCYNVQTAVDAKHKLIVAHDVTNEATDRDWLSPMALAANEVLESEALEVVADQGYYHGHEVKKCLEAGITPYLPRPVTSASGKLGLYSKDDFAYDAETDTYACPAGERLSFRFDTIELGRHIRLPRYLGLQAMCSESPVHS